MFDTEKILRLTNLLQKIPEEFSDAYVVHEGVFITEAAALFRRLKIPVRAMILDTVIDKQVWGIPVVKMAEVSQKFNARTVFIMLVKKPMPFIQTDFDIAHRGGY